MGLPMVQVFMIIARQMSKPVADLVMRYGKDHPLFRNKILIPVGRGLANLSTRLRMKNLGLGSPKDIKQISESSALEQASEFVQQVVIFGYTLSVFYIYTVYSKTNEKLTATPDELKALQKDFNEQIQKINEQIKILDMQLNNKDTKSWNIFRWFSSSNNKRPSTTKETCLPSTPVSIPNIHNSNTRPLSPNIIPLSSKSHLSESLKRSRSVPAEFTTSISRNEALNLIGTFEMAESNNNI